VLSEFFQHHVSENIRDLLHTDFDQRPCASTLSRLFTSYCQILDLSDEQTPIEIRSYPSYQEWKLLVEKYPFESQLLYQLAEAYERTGAENISTILLKEMVQNYVKTGKLAKEIVGAKEEAAEATITVLQKVGDALTKKGQHDEAIAMYTAAIERDPDRLSVWKSLADVNAAKGDHDEALRTYEAALRKEPMNLWLWHNICEAHLSRNDIDSTISFCRHQWILSQENPSALITLSSLFSAKSDYLLSINTYMDMFVNENQNVRSALTDFEKHLISTRWKQPDDISKRYRYVTFPSLMTRLQPRALNNIHSVKTLLSTAIPFVVSEDTKMTVHFAAWTGNADLMKPHIVSRRQNMKDKDGMTALHLAVWNMHLEMVDLLLKSPVTLVSAENERGWTALHLAVWNNDVAMIEKLVQVGAINAISKNRGNSPMFWAAQNGHVDAIKALKKAGADLAEENVEGWTPMHVAALHGRANMIKVLKNARCDVSARTKTGSTPMHLAVKYGHLDAIKTLIDAGANVSIRDVDGLTPMDLAEREWKMRADGTELLKVLKSYKFKRKH
jgi:ankyrin repeat protein/tetratricopeptide (TPR) repeat protein